MNIIRDEDFDVALNHLSRDFRFHRDNNNKKSIQMSEELTQREKERNIRETLQSRHGPTAEVHDQVTAITLAAPSTNLTLAMKFYRDHKLLLVLFRALAVMPIERSSPGRVTFSWKSKASIYAFCFYVCATFVVLIVGYERVKILQATTKFDESIYGILFIIFLIPHFWIPFVGWGVANDVARYKTNWGTFQVRYYRVTGENLQFPKLKMLIVIISIGCLLCAVLFIMSLSILLDGFPLWHTCAYCEFEGIS